MPGVDAAVMVVKAETVETAETVATAVQAAGAVMPGDLSMIHPEVATEAQVALARMEEMAETAGMVLMAEMAEML